jgi:hypothetical protein
MCFALFIATGSFFLGQAKVIPMPLRIFPVLTVLALLPLVFMVYWLVRLRKRHQKSTAHLDAARVSADVSVMLSATSRTAGRSTRRRYSRSTSRDLHPGL